VETYMVVRRRAWPMRGDAYEAADRATVEAMGLSEMVAWTRSYIVEETDGTVGSICIYEAESPEAIRRHSAAAELPVDEIVKVADAVIVRTDSVAAAP